MFYVRSVCSHTKQSGDQVHPPGCLLKNGVWEGRACWNGTMFGNGGRVGMERCLGTAVSVTEFSAVRRGKGGVCRFNGTQRCLAGGMDHDSAGFPL
ncbi:hypothetical protein D3C75_1099400 [compost metagenome]